MDLTDTLMGYIIMAKIPDRGILNMNIEVLSMAVKDNEKNNVNEAAQAKSCCCADGPSEAATEIAAADIGMDRDAMQDEDVCCCGGKHKIRDDKEKKDLMNRLKRIEGQVRGLQNMLERDAYCPDILVQASAVNSALNSFSRVLLTNHIRTCVADNIREGNDEVIDELTATLQKLMK